MRVLAVPVKSLDRAKSRLAPILTPAERAALSLVMVEDVLDACSVQAGWDVWVVSRDEAALEIAARRGARPLVEKGGSLLEAVRQTEAEVTGRSSQLAVVLADLPLITAEAVSAALGLGQGNGVVAAPAGSDGGMNVLLADRHAVTGVDVSGAMLREARRRYPGRVSLVQGSAFRLPFADESFGGAVSAFVLRNLENLPSAFAELARVVAPGGRVALLDITEPSQAWFRRLFDAYFRTATPTLGALVGKRAEYSYLVRSLSNLPSRDELCGMLRRAGFVDCGARELTGGTATLWTGTRGPKEGRLAASRNL